MLLTTDLIIQQGLDTYNKRPSSLPMDVQVAITYLNETGHFVTFCWHGLRQMRSASAVFEGWDVKVKSLAGRTMVTFSKGEEWISYLGAEDGFTAGLHGCQVDHISARQFIEICESFANAFTVEMFLIDESLRIA